jgi:hypothetical protein
VASLDFAHIADDETRALVGERTDENYEDYRNEREKATLRRTGKTETQVELSLGVVTRNVGPCDPIARHWRLSGHRDAADVGRPFSCPIARMLLSLSSQRVAFLATCAVLAAETACATQTQIVASNPAMSLAPTCTDAVAAYPDRDHVPYDYYEVALVTAEGNSVYTGNGDLLKGMRSKAASVGANGLVINSLGATHATVKVIGAAVGSGDAERKGKAIAIWMPSDTARVREACGK